MLVVEEFHLRQFVGPNEAERGIVAIKNLGTGEQIEIERDDLIATTRKLIG